MNRRRKMIAYRRSHRYLEGMKIAGLISGLRGAIRTFMEEHK